MRQARDEAFRNSNETERGTKFGEVLSEAPTKFRPVENRQGGVELRGGRIEEGGIFGDEEGNRIVYRVFGDRRAPGTGGRAFGAA